MSDQPSNPFDDALRRIAAEAARVAKQVADADPEDLARASGIDVDKVREWTDEARRRFGDGVFPAPSASRPDEDEDAIDDVVVPSAPPEHRGPAADPRALATDEQGRALAALDSGRWKVDPTEGRITIARLEAPGPPPEHPRRTLRELAERDWIDEEGLPSVAGGVALVRWLERPVD